MHSSAPHTCCMPCPPHPSCARPFVTFRNKLIFYGELLAPCPLLELEDHPLSGVRDCLFNIFAAAWRSSSPSSTSGRPMPWWQGTHLTWFGACRVAVSYWIDWYIDIHVAISYLLNCNLLINFRVDCFNTYISRIISNIRRTFYILFPVEKLKWVLNSRNVHLSKFYLQTHLQKLGAS
jgi:hypothetical protein